MTLYSLARKNIVQNIRQYMLYLYSMVISVAIYFTFVSLQYNQQLLDSTVTLGKIESAFFAASVILIIFAAIFIWYSNSFFTRTRKKEVGLYALFGMSKKKIGTLLFYENIIIGAIALMIGIGLGILFSKLFMMIIFKIMGFSLEVTFHLSNMAFLQTIVVFALIILVTSIHSYRLIYRFSLSELFKAERKGERLAKGSPITSILAVLFIGAAYTLFLNPNGLELIDNDGLRILTATGSLIIGSYLFMNSLVTFLLKAIRKVPPIFLAGKNLLSITNLLYRFKGNVLILTVISLLSTVTLFACTTTLGFYSNLDHISKLNNPYSYMFNLKNEKAEAEINSLLKQGGGNELSYSYQLEYLTMKPGATGIPRVPGFFQNMLISESSFQQLMQLRGTNVSVDLGRGEAIAFYDGNMDVKSDPFTGKKVKLPSGEELTISKYKSYSFLNQGNMLFPLVVDEELYKELKTEITPETLKIYKVANEKNLSKLDGEITEIADPLTGRDDGVIYSSFYEQYHYGMETYGLMIFIGGFLGLVFLAATGSMIYFKQLMEAVSDKGRYQILRKIGIPETEVKKSVARQVWFVFALPLLLAFCNSALISYCMGEFIQISMLVPFTVCLAVYLLIYASYFILTNYSYLRIIKPSS
ncbi:ABC transporter permease [Neobacillus niacini]|uniref:ABC transporter permease n=1 Tax=Neobacillus niacini TaxID=86668 RepID=UPI0021CB5B03|nr:ABC transporter permease [Neobacillus niacini]MCM3764596.1 ABC transporter permease [Neobacillus niacini]